MSSYDDRINEEYNKTVDFLLAYAESLGAEYVCSRTERFATTSKGTTICEEPEMNIYKFGDEYFRIEKLSLPDKPWMVFSFSDSVEGPYEDADPFPYDLSEEELKEEVRFALRIE